MTVTVQVVTLSDDGQESIREVESMEMLGIIDELR